MMKKRGLIPVDKETYKTFIYLIKDNFNALMKQRSQTQKRALVQIWRLKESLKMKRIIGKDVLFFGGKKSSN